MVTAGRGRAPASEDLTARARIRDAALLRFAEHGMRGATYRGIAEAAGVSVGLVQHHFGSKEALRAACDAYVLDVVRRVSVQSTSGESRDPGFLSAAMRADLPVRRYLARALVDGSPAAAQLFDDLVEMTERYLADPPPGVSPPTTRDLHAYAAATAAMSAGVVVLHEHLSRALGTDTLSMEGSPRLRRAILEVFDDRLLSREIVERGHAVLDQYEAAAAAEGDHDD
ncbi:TetR/AcrR family transcriptional regulator [Actinomadura rubrisoli]|uniref:TetR/AcrR family transcriptional regulator n=1 Tax=Actinomadura rubrisoli TaxID=2530368 RepID=A0A4R5B0X9_9ACTN|nr:TetR/AcrR family transcriptional regulator [Actinomadura rubrisoli]TDD79241.1 TetR/AcrR family transcriptional regulator [Actinomadura rubrisoli]